jgi:hypothetical protein
MAELRDHASAAHSAADQAAGKRNPIHAIMPAIDDYAERDGGHREFFWERPPSVG